MTDDPRGDGDGPEATGTDEPPAPPWETDDPAWPVRDVETVWETPFFDAGYDAVERPDGEAADYYWLDPADAVGIVAVRDGDLLLVEQYRPRLRARTLGFPAGFVEDGEDPAAAAARELREETGFRAGDLAYLDTQTVSPWTRYVRHLYAASGLEPGEQDLDDGEYVDVVTVPVEAATERFRGGDGPANGLALAALCLAREEGLL